MSRRESIFCATLFALAFSVSPARAGVLVQGSATGTFLPQNNDTALGPTVNGLRYTGASFGDPNPIEVDGATTVSLGTFDLGLFGLLEQWRFQLNLSIAKPDDTDPRDVGQIAEVEGLVVFGIGGASIDFDNIPIAFSSSEGNFTLTLSDVSVSTLRRSATLYGTFRTANTVSTDEEPAFLGLLISLMGVAGFAWKRKMFVRV